MSSHDLNKTEQTVLLAASNIFSGFASDGTIDSGKKAEKAAEYSVAIALKMAHEVERCRNHDGVALGGDDPGPFPWKSIG